MFFHPFPRFGVFPVSLSPSPPFPPRTVIRERKLDAESILRTSLGITVPCHTGSAKGKQEARLRGLLRNWQANAWPLAREPQWWQPLATTLPPAGPGSEECCLWSVLSPVVGRVTFPFRPQTQVQRAVLTPRGGSRKPAPGSSPVLATGQSSKGSLLNHICLGDFCGQFGFGSESGFKD